MRDSAVRIELGIPLAVAAKLAGVSRPTMRLYEADPQCVRSEKKRSACASLYARLRDLLSSTRAA